MKNLLAALLLIISPITLAEEILEQLEEYLDFSEYVAGSISVEQLSATEAAEVLYIDTRNATQYASDHIPGAINIEWREVLNRRDEIPSDKTVVLYCDTGLLSSKAHLILQLAGYENIKVLLGGYQTWRSEQNKLK